jgi:hypothetical protein
MKTTLFILALLFSALCSMGQENKASIGPTDTLLFNEFNNLPGSPTILTYGYSNGNGFFFGTNYIDIDQDPTTPYEPGVQAFAQGFPVDTGQSYYILDILVRVGIKIKDQNSTGTPLILSVHLLDDSSTYNVNTSGGSQSYTVHSPGTALGSASIPFDDMITGTGVNLSVAHLTTPILVEKNFCVVVDLMDFYLNGDRFGLWVSAPNGASNIYGMENTLWLYPNPMLWLQVNHLYGNVNRAIAIFPVVDDGTFGIENDRFLNGIKLGQSYPNPAKDMARIEYEIQKASQVKLELMDANGKLIKQMDLGKKAAGRYHVEVQTSELASGMYFYTLHSNGKSMTKKLVVSGN